MWVGVISDVHANRVALDAVLEDMPDVDRLVCAGDVVGYNPWPADCIDRVRERADVTVQGNHDRAVATDPGFRFNSLAGAGLRYTREALDDAHVDWLATLPSDATIAVGDRHVRVVHGHPTDPNRYTRPDEFGPELLRADVGRSSRDADGSDPDVLAMGHTHVQSHEVYPEGIVMNPGSVGQPRDGDPRAAYAVVDLEEMTVDERRGEYDVDRVIEELENVDLPTELGERLREGR